MSATAAVELAELLERLAIRRTTVLRPSDDEPPPRRHSAASLMAQAGVPVTSISAQLGHADPSVTQSIYSHVPPGMQDEAAQQLAAMLGQ